MLTLAFAAVTLLAAPPPPPSPFVHKTTLQTQAYPGGGNHTVTVRTVVDSGHAVAPHTHPGIEMAYVLSGSAKVRIAGRPDMQLKAGDSVAVPPRAVHEMIDTGPGPLTILSTYVVDPQAPIASPAR